jgi:hypothetical protein
MRRPNVKYSAIESSRPRVASASGDAALIVDKLAPFALFASSARALQDIAWGKSLRIAHLTDISAGNQSLAALRRRWHVFRRASDRAMSYRSRALETLRSSVVGRYWCPESQTHRKMGTQSFRSKGLGLRQRGCRDRQVISSESTGARSRSFTATSCLILPKHRL